MKLTTDNYNDMYKFQIYDARNKEPDLRDKILGMILHIENGKNHT